MGEVESGSESPSWRRVIQLTHLDVVVVHEVDVRSDEPDVGTPHRAKSLELTPCHIQRMGIWVRNLKLRVDDLRAKSERHARAG